MEIYCEIITNDYENNYEYMILINKRLIIIPGKPFFIVSKYIDINIRMCYIHLNNKYDAKLHFIIFYLITWLFEVLDLT